MTKIRKRFIAGFAVGAGYGAVSGVVLGPWSIGGVVGMGALVAGIVVGWYSHKWETGT